MGLFANLLWRSLDGWRQRQGLQGITAPTEYQWPQHGGKILLHVGCGSARKDDAGPGFQSADWREIRLDVDVEAKPDIVGSILDMSALPAASVDAVYSSHTLEHLYAYELPIALAEMRRVIKPDGVVVTRVPDLQAAARMIAEDRLFDTAYISPMGPVTPFDILYSHRLLTHRDRPYMAHHYGFTLNTLVEVFREAGFAAVAGARGHFDLWALATPQPLDDVRMRELARQYLPH